MELFEKIGDKISSKSKDVAKKAKDITELAKLNSKVHDYESMVKDLHMQIGKAYYEANRENPAPEYMGLFQQVINAQGEAERCREEIAQIKGLRSCISCGSDIPNNSTFCPACGTKNEIIDVVVSQPQAAVDSVLCSGCGANLPSDTMFCPNCGNKMN